MGGVYSPLCTHGNTAITDTIILNTIMEHRKNMFREQLPIYGGRSMVCVMGIKWNEANYLHEENKQQNDSS